MCRRDGPDDFARTLPAASNLVFPRSESEQPRKEASAGVLRSSLKSPEKRRRDSQSSVAHGRFVGLGFAPFYSQFASDLKHRIHTRSWTQDVIQRLRCCPHRPQPHRHVLRAG
jgi:hypothetical protein